MLHVGFNFVPYLNEPHVELHTAAGSFVLVLFTQPKKGLTQTPSRMCQSDMEHLYPRERKEKTMILS